MALDLFFVAPAGSFAVSDAECLVTLTVMPAVGLLTGNLTAGVRYQARVARHGEQPACYLYEMADGQRRSRYVHQADELRRQTLSTIRLVNNMLDMARIKADGFRPQTGWIALEEIISSALKSLGVSCRCATSGWIYLGK